MKKNFVIFMFLACGTFVYSQDIQPYSGHNTCSHETCLERCVNHKKICGLWDKKYYLDIYRQVITENQINNPNKINIGDSIVFPPFVTWEKPIGKMAILVVEKHESLWSMVHRFLAETYLLCLDQRNNDLVNHEEIPKSKSFSFGTTTIKW